MQVKINEHATYFALIKNLKSWIKKKSLQTYDREGVHIYMSSRYYNTKFFFKVKESITCFEMWSIIMILHIFTLLQFHVEFQHLLKSRRTMLLNHRINSYNNYLDTLNKILLLMIFRKFDINQIYSRSDIIKNKLTFYIIHR